MRLPTPSFFRTIALALALAVSLTVRCAIGGF